MGEVSNPDSWLQLLSTLDVVIDAVGGSADIRTVSAKLLSVISNAAADLSIRPENSSKLTYIYSSGTWVHGDNRKDIVSDTTPCTNPAAAVAWRLDQEQAVIANPNLNGLVIRPALLYGRSGSLLAPLFKRAAEEKRVTWPGTPGGRYALIHTDDLADLYVKAAEKACIAGGKIFDAANDFTESVDDLLRALKEIAGAGSYAYSDPANCTFLFLG